METVSGTDHFGEEDEAQVARFIADLHEASSVPTSRQFHAS